METLFDLADKLYEKREIKKQLEDDLKAINAEIEDIERALVDSMLADEMQNFTGNGRQYILTTRLYVNAKPGSMPQICKWMKVNGLQDLVKEQVHPQTLQAWAKEQITEYGEIPAELAEYLNTYEKASITIRNRG